jgi:hypothetical protein
MLATNKTGASTAGERSTLIDQALVVNTCAANGLRASASGASRGAAVASSTLRRSQTIQRTGGIVRPQPGEDCRAHGVQVDKDV